MASNCILLLGFSIVILTFITTSQALECFSCLVAETCTDKKANCTGTYCSKIGGEKDGKKAYSFGCAGEQKYAGATDFDSKGCAKGLTDGAVACFCKDKDYCNTASSVGGAVALLMSALVAGWLMKQ